MTVPVPKPEGRCSGELCWYTLPLVDGLIMAHSKTGTLDDCEGAGRPPLVAATPDPRFRDQLAEALRSHRNLGIREGEWTCACGRQFSVLDGWLIHRADALLPLIEARVQAAAAQRAAEECASSPARRSTRCPVRSKSPSRSLTCSTAPPSSPSPPSEEGDQ